MDIDDIQPGIGSVIQVFVPSDAIAENVAQELGEKFSTSAIIGTDPSAQMSYLRDTCIEEVVLGLENQGEDPAHMQVRGEEMLAAVGLSDYAEKNPTQLSGGQTRRLAAACVAIREPEVLIICEPSAGLDPTSLAMMVQLLHSLRNTCVLAVSSMHWPELGGEVVGEIPQPAPVSVDVISSYGFRGSLGPLTARRGQEKKRWWQSAKPSGNTFSVGPVTIPIRGGGVTWLRGANGTGKTSLLRAAAGLDGAQRPAEPRGLVLQSPYDQVIYSTLGDFVSDSALRELLELDAAEHPLDLSASRLRLAQTAHVVGMGHGILLMDEPDSLLSLTDRALMHQLIHNALELGAAIVLTCHDPGFVEEIAQYVSIQEVELSNTGGLAEGAD
ncbi:MULTISPECIES: ATP-binding cassette domain-containing protein [unclassified Corynebacterium]|uniref:ATP-binding cassette domain-containing protein n=1 Tax=Corynebacterium TaxID=1716 RepID=UPI0025519996|nr:MULTISPECIES: ATP-binding cassette domain-containing protein [unclassified Corynebacterium]MDK8452229.1 ATP-binding cassette domain-containing protein [Corynebacterium sp. MSK084]MDK8475378.1 ATP-binding cassette domain-containing protein [Corynebacterium sp. MSK310]MDK8514166.1 ATP-binding cassette domain-containing protein [Corynebacterium sp. MSK123]MDK8547086.1 ATP-binding cassette domain-containing protein [Corynebacterium sp. MSK222]MDK8671963.1 ATP-binding cassette domain-containing 